MEKLIAALLCLFCVPAFAAFPVVPVPADAQAAMLESDDPQLAANKRLAYDLYRIVTAKQLDQLETVASTDFINHNPNEESGFEGMKEFLSRVIPGEPRPIAETLENLVTIFAEGDMVILAFARELDHPDIPGEKYTSTWFDMFRVQDGLVVEHWDAATIPAE